MFTQQEQQALTELRQTSQIKLETRVKSVDGGYLITVTEFFVNDEHTIVANASHTKICTKPLDVVNYLTDWYIGRPLETTSEQAVPESKFQDFRNTEPTKQ